MAARRGKTQARRNSGNGTPGWVWLVAGLVLGAALFFIVPGLMKKEGDGFFRPQPNPDARPAPVADADSVTETEASPGEATQAAATTKQTQYDFYTLLPGKEVQMSDAELAASAREEAARAAVAAAAAAKSDAPRPLPEPLPDAPVASSPPAPAAAPSATQVATAAIRPAAIEPTSDARYILQAGAFGGSGDAEATKAKIAMLGLSARVESAQIKGKTVYRVRMGPYGSASELAEAKQKLASGGLPAMAIKAQ